MRFINTTLKILKINNLQMSIIANFLSIK